jgi:hypothetical protein
VLVLAVLIAVAAVVGECGPGALAVADRTVSAAEPLPLCSFDEDAVDQRGFAQS